MSFKKITHFSIKFSKTYWKETLALMMILLAFIFFRNERKELNQIVFQLQDADSLWILTGGIITAFYILSQTGMYVASFRAIRSRLQWKDALELYLKRNFLSVFLPAGGISALAYTPSRLRRKLKTTQMHQASGLYAYAGMITIFIVGLPIIFHSISGEKDFQNAWMGLVFIAGMLSVVFYIVRSLQKKKKVYKFIEQKFPGFIPKINELFELNVSFGRFFPVILFSIGVELYGILLILISMYALGLTPSLEAACVGYIISILFMVLSPFLKGLGAVELTLVYVLGIYGYSSLEALSITMLYRFFEFWLPLASGIIAFALKGRQLFVRIAPALLTFILGLINIISVVTPPLAERLRLTRQFMPVGAMEASNTLILFIGLALLVTSAFLIKGFKSAWYIALLLSGMSLLGNLTKALDYEEAIFAAVILVILVSTRNQYRIKSSLKWVRLGIISVITVFTAVCVLGFVSFYFIDKKHFGEDFSWQQSMMHTANIFLLATDADLVPITRFGKEFLSIIRILGFVAWGFLLFTLIRPYIIQQEHNESYRNRAMGILEQFGVSAVDYFKVYRDKLLFISNEHEAFVSYRIANGFAVVLEEPVCAEEHKVEVLSEFEQHCKKSGLKTAYYRVDENSLQWFRNFKKQKVFIGQEAILDLSAFTLEGRDKKSLRNGLNSLKKKGYQTSIIPAPIDQRTLDELKNISDEWLATFDKKEQIFSQGMFDTNELINQDVIVIKDETGTVKAFLNVIPDYNPSECTYDLIRKTSDAPGGCMDALIVRLIEYGKERKLNYLNLGMVPLTGNENPQTPAERIVKFASQKLKRFRHFQSLRDFKDKYASLWQNKYIIYSNDFDLLQLPAALNKVMQP